MSEEKVNPIEKVVFDDELAPLAPLLFNRSYGRLVDGVRETTDEVFLGRTIEGLQKLGNLTQEQVDRIKYYQSQLKVLTSGRGLFVQGTEAAEKIENVYSHYNCSNINIESWYHFGLLMNMAMQGTGTGAKLEPMYIEKLPVIINKLNVEIKDSIGTVAPDARLEETDIRLIESELGVVGVVEIHVGDSRKGWVQAYENFLSLSTNEDLSREVNVHIYLGNVRPKDLPLKGFGGVSNPTALPFLFSKCAAVLNKAIGRKLNSVECCKLIDEAALVVVAGSIRRCLPKGTLVTTPYGSVPIESIGIGDEVLTTKGIRRVLDIFHQGVQPLVRINTSKGYLYCSINHKVAVSQDTSYVMTAAKDLNLGDNLIFSLLGDSTYSINSNYSFNQLDKLLERPLELEFFRDNSYYLTRIQELLSNAYIPYEVSLLDESKLLITVHIFQSLNGNRGLLDSIKEVYGAFIGSFVDSTVAITDIDLDTGIEEETFDIEVEEVHEFFAEGFLVSNSAGMRQGASDDEVFAVAKDNLWIQDSEGNWKIDPERDALRVANHTRVFKHKPTYEECLTAVTKQYYSGEGAIQWAGEAVARSNADLLVTKELKQEFLTKYATSQQEAIDFLYTLNPYMDEKELQHRLGRYGLNPSNRVA
jgi:hypothetical protein